MSALDYICYLTNAFWFRLAGCKFESTIPNYLSLTRAIIAAPIIITIDTFWMQAPYFKWVLLAIYIFTCLTDAIDGYLARSRFSRETEFGRYIDQLADKIFIIEMILYVFWKESIGHGVTEETGIVLLFFLAGVTELSLVLVNVFRDVTVVFLRIFINLPSSFLSKCKTAFQMIALGFILVRGHFEHFFGFPFYESGMFFLWTAAMLAVVSFVGYAVDATPILWPRLKKEAKNDFPTIKTGIMRWLPLNLG